MDIVFISNPDVDIAEDSILKLKDAFANTQYGLLSCLEYDGTGKLSTEPVWHIHTYWEDLLDCFILGRRYLRKRPQEKLDMTRKIHPVELVKGSFFGIRVQDFTEIGGLDENVFLFCEERILGRRFHNGGKSVGLVTDAHYQHNHSASIKHVYKSVAKQIGLLYRSRMYYQTAYNRIGWLKKLALRIAMGISLMEYRCVDAAAYVKYSISERKRS